MTISSGDFFWYDVMTSDPKPATDFYTKVVGWGAEEAGVEGSSYTVLELDGGKGMGVAGLMPIPPEAKSRGAQPGWNGYVYVDDVDAMTKRAIDAGGEQMHEPTDIPTVGRFSVVADPQGAVFALFKPNPRDDDVNWPKPMTPGTVGWHELHAADGAKAFDFYGKLFDWEKKEAMDMGPMGTYQLFATSDEAVGGIMTDNRVPRPYWLYYIAVDAIDAAVERVKAGGGEVLNGPMEVPGGAWVIQGRDPQGAIFALVAPKR
jgi:predicted enzyme related to lactoylglutathione lyase